MIHIVRLTKLVYLSSAENFYFCHSNVHISVGLRLFVFSRLTDDQDLVVVLPALSCSLLHGPSLFAIKAKIYGVLYKQSSSVAFDETSSYWSAPKNS